MFKRRPFTQSLGARALVPLTSKVVEIFPTLLKLGKQSLPLPLTGPVRPFTIFQDLEKGLLEVTGKAKEGYFRYQIRQEEGQILFVPQKGSLPSQQVLAKAAPFSSEDDERLFLPKTKKLDIDLIRKRLDPAEFLPLWYRLSQLTPKVSLPAKREGNYALLGEEISFAFFQNLFSACFEDLFAPRLNDSYQGLAPQTDAKISPIPLIHEGAKLIRSTFFVSDKKSLSFLPKLPKELHAGSFSNLKTEEGDSIDFIWSKKALKKVVIRAGTDRQVLLRVKKGLTSYRLNKKETKKLTGLLSLEKGKTYHLDRFQK